MTVATACGKLILCGEHAVVYGQPALALPLTDLRARVKILAQTGFRLEAPDLQLHCSLQRAQMHRHPLETSIWQALDFFQVELNQVTIQVQSDLPMGCGLGSGAAVTAALFRALSIHLNHPITLQDELNFIHGIEKLYHGNPSGIDGEVIAREQALLFSKGQKSKMLTFPAGFNLVLCNSGPAKPTHEVVAMVRRNYQQEPDKYAALFTEIGRITQSVQIALENTNISQLGSLLNKNHQLLQAMKVSSPRLDQLVQIALEAGALGAKLSGAGQGGICFALCDNDTQKNIIKHWQAAQVSWIKTCHF